MRSVGSVPVLPWFVLKHLMQALFTRPFTIFRCASVDWHRFKVWLNIGTAIEAIIAFSASSDHQDSLAVLARERCGNEKKIRQRLSDTPITMLPKTYRRPALIFPIPTRSRRMSWQLQKWESPRQAGAQSVLQRKYRALFPPPARGQSRALTHAADRTASTSRG